jgi:fructokinase
MIYTLGESLMDMITTHDGMTIAKPGGSLLNVSVSLGRTGRDVSLISEMGDDETGEELVEFLHENGVCTDLITIYENAKTSKALAQLDENSKPSYTFQKAYPNTRWLAKSPVFTENDILILGSMYSRDPEIKNDLDAYLKAAKRGGALIVYDPNVRHNHQLKNEASRKMLLNNLAFAHIIKGSDEDFLNIFNTVSIQKIKEEIFRINKKVLLIITLGVEGSLAFYGGGAFEEPALKTQVISTIGAGDAFTAGLVHAFIDKQSKGRLKLSDEGIESMLAEGSRFSSLVCQSMDNYIPVRK